VGGIDDDEPLGRLLAMALSATIEELHQRLEQQGWGQVRPLWGFVLLSLRDRPRSIGAVGELLGISKQAAAKVSDGLCAAGLVQRGVDPADRRVSALRLTEHGERFLADVESAYDAIEAGWAREIGRERLAELRSALAAILAARYGDTRPPLRPAL
jgi:DNA-binding MarR family transcriptional regulator